MKGISLIIQQINEPFICMLYFQDFAAADISIETRNQLTEALYNELMVAILKILDKLDLSSAAPNEVNSAGRKVIKLFSSSAQLSAH